MAANLAVNDGVIPPPAFSSWLCLFLLTIFVDVFTPPDFEVPVYFTNHRCAINPTLNTTLWLGNYPNWIKWERRGSKWPTQQDLMTLCQ
jgi:hypothetical protein